MLWDLDGEILEKVIGEGPVLKLGPELDEGGPREVIGAVLVNRAASDVYDLVSDPTSYPRFMRQAERAKILDRGIERIHSSHRLRLKLAVVSLKLDYETITELQPKDMSLSFHHWAGELRGMEGRWVIRQMGATRCAAFHSLTVDFREAGLIARKALQVEPSLNAALQASTVVMTLEALKKYFE
jgi:ribosome-associated toxin RatA of RatAB toxin-antitoxin module